MSDNGDRHVRTRRMDQAGAAASRAWSESEIAVFLSDRFVERARALSLYDTLTQLGYETFLDQFVLDAASRLSHQLETTWNTVRLAS